VSRRDGQRVLHRQLDEPRVVTGTSHQPCPGGLAEGEPETQVRRRAHQGLVQPAGRFAMAEPAITVVPVAVPDGANLIFG